MGARSNQKENRIRQQIAAEAARIMAIEGVADFHQAKRKAASRLGLDNLRHLPSNSEIEQALGAYQRLFMSDTQPRRLQLLRETAIEVMRMFAAFRPALVGPVLSGTADNHSRILLHVFADTPESVSLFLLQEGIPYHLGERRFTLTSGRQTGYPTFSFLADETAIEVSVFPPQSAAEPPQSAIANEPMPRASIRDVEELLYDADDKPS